jgi:acetyl-CoA C-acetyltransferase
LPVALYFATRLKERRIKGEDGMTQDPQTTPVIIGVGQINDRPADPMAGLDPVGLMAAALRLADADAGGDWLRRMDSLDVVDQISFRHLNPLPNAVATELGINPSYRHQPRLPMGDSPIRLLNDAANRIASGTSRVAAIVGAEALRTAAQRAALAAGDKATDHNALRKRPKDFQPSYRDRYGLSAPVDLYPLYENATRAAWGQTLAEGQQESAVIWSLFSQVAAANEGAWIRAPKTSDEILRVSDGNRPIAFPYNKLMVANSSVNQGAGFIVTSLALAQERGVPDSRIIFVGQGAAAHETDEILDRDSFSKSAGMQVSLSKALEVNRMTIADIDHAELYSCFPCVPKMARRIIGWPAERAATVFGGLTFGGGPIANYMCHAVVGMVDALRSAGGNGLLFANGGFATYNHSIVVSSRPLAAARLPADYDFQRDAEQLRAPSPLVDEAYHGPATIETYTVLFDRTGAPRWGVVVARSPSDARFLAKVPATDTALIAFLTDGRQEPVGTSGFAVAGEDGLTRWTRSSPLS